MESYFLKRKCKQIYNNVLGNNPEFFAVASQNYKTRKKEA